MRGSERSLGDMVRRKVQSLARATYSTRSYVRVCSSRWAFNNCRSNHARKSACMRLAMGFAAALRHLHQNGIAVVAARRADILIDANSFELKIMPAIGTLLAHAAAAAAAAAAADSADVAACPFHASAIGGFVEFLRFLRPMMQRSSDDCCDGDHWQFSSERVLHVLRGDERDAEVTAHEEVAACVAI